jgi:hypothetical protein
MSVMNQTSTESLIERTIEFFLPLCSDKSTMTELREMASDPERWCFGHALFSRIRGKTLRVEESGSDLILCQYSFEEICAKTMFNLSEHYDPECKEFPPPFDDDSALWFVPIAMQYAYALGAKDFAASVLKLE